MSKFVVADGHTASGTIGCGAVSKIDESNCTREIGPLVVQKLQERGHTVNHLRIDKGNSYKYEDCYVRAQQANSIWCDLYIEIHINAGGGTGSEVCVTGKSAEANQYAAKVSAALSNALGIPNRGVKTQSLIVLNRTSMPAILVECLFCDSSDADKYNADVIATAIADGLVGAAGTTRKLGWNKNNVGWWYCTNVEKGYYYTSNNGWKYIDGEWYIFDDNGYALESAWYKDGSTWYYLDENCQMVQARLPEIVKWKWIDGKCYCFGTDGALYVDCTTYDGYKVDVNGAWIK